MFEFKVFPIFIVEFHENFCRLRDLKLGVVVRSEHLSNAPSHYKL